MTTIPTLKESILTLFERMTRLYDPRHEMNASYQFVFTDIDEGYPVHLRFSGSHAEYTEEYKEQSDVIVHIPAELWLEIAGGFRNPVWALITGKYRVTGNRALLRLLPRLLTREISVPHSERFPQTWRVPENVLVLVGNPRKKNGLTGLYLEPFLEGLRQPGVAVEAIHLYDRKINHCLGCFRCWTTTPGICIQRDDQEELLQKMTHADLIVYAVPLYLHSMPGLVKDHLDRQLPKVYPYVEKVDGLTRHPRRLQKKQSLILFSICGFPEPEQFGPLVATFGACTRHDNVNFIGTVLIPGAMELFHNPTKRMLLSRKIDLLRSAGEQFVKHGKAKKRTLKEISKNPVSSGWHRGTNLHWHEQIAAAGKPHRPGSEDVHFGADRTFAVEENAALSGAVEGGR